MGGVCASICTEWSIIFLPEEVQPTKSVELNEPPEWTYCSCVDAAKWATGNQGRSWGNASQIKSNVDHPIPGGFGLTTEGPGHLFVIKDVFMDGGVEYVWTVEWNYNISLEEVASIEAWNKWTGERHPLTDAPTEGCKPWSRMIRTDDPVIRGWVLPSGPDL